MEKGKYGLQLRVPPSQQKKKPTRPSLPTPLGFRDDDEDDVEREISRQASKNKSLKDIEEQHKKALQEDPSVFDYDGVYDEMKEKVVRPLAEDRQERKPRYIQALIEKAKVREREHEIVYERKLAKERSKDDHMYADKEKFVTGAYKRKLAEQAKWEAEERLRQLREEKEDITKGDMSEFYFSLSKNVAFGAREAGMKKDEKRREEVKVPSAEIKRPLVSTQSDRYSVREGHEGKTSTLPEERSESIEPIPVSASSKHEAGSEPSVPVADQPKTDHHKRNQDAVAAAKERFLARKKTKEGTSCIQ